MSTRTKLESESCMSPLHMKLHHSPKSRRSGSYHNIWLKAHEVQHGSCWLATGAAGVQMATDCLFGRSWSFGIVLKIWARI